MRRWAFLWLVLIVSLVTDLSAQQPPVPPPGFGPAGGVQQPPPRPQPNQPAAQPQQPPAPGAPPAPSATPNVYGGITFNNASLTEVIDMLARQLHINYVLDPRVKGGVILNTYGETKNIDTRSLLEAILRINGFGMVQQGELFRIVPLNEISHQPLPPEQVTNPKDIPDDDRTMLNLVFLKYATVEDLAKLLDPFRGENSTMFSYAPANLLLILDSRRNMRRTMELISLFDNDTLANQRVRLFETRYGRPTDLVKELDTIVKSISLNEKNSPIKFLAVDRIKTIIAVASNPGAFAEVEKWIDKLDIPVKASIGGTENYVYRVKYGNACMLAMGITMLYGGGGGYGMGGGGFGGGMQSMGLCAIQAMSGQGGGFGGGIGGGIGAGGMGFGGMGYGGMGGMGYGMNPYMAMMMNPSMMTGAGGYGAGYNNASPFTTPNSITQQNVAGQPSGVAPSIGQNGTDLTGQYLQGQPGFGPFNPHAPRVVPNPFNNSLMIQATPNDYEQIEKVLRDMDIPPRQVLIDAKIYEVTLSNNFSTSLMAQYQDLSPTSSHHLIANLAAPAVNLTDGFLVGRAKELLAQVQILEGESKAKTVSAPSVIATDSIPASLNVGTTVPVLTAQAVTGAQQNGSSLFANTIGNVSTGVTLSVTAQVNPSGIVTLIINQNVSDPGPPPPGGPQSSTFSQRSVQTQVTVQDGDTIAIGGIINEQNQFSTAGVPFLNHLPIIGAMFGNRSYQKSREELIIFMTPHVIFDTNELQEASHQLEDQMRKLKRDINRNQ